MVSDFYGSSIPRLSEPASQRAGANPMTMDPFCATVDAWKFNLVIGLYDIHNYTHIYIFSRIYLYIYMQHVLSAFDINISTYTANWGWYVPPIDVDLEDGLWFCLRHCVHIISCMYVCMYIYIYTTYIQTSIHICVYIYGGFLKWEYPQIINFKTGFPL